MEIFYIALLTVLASGVGTLTGFGTSTIMVPVLLFFLPLPQTLLLVGVIHLFGDIWKVLLFKKSFDWKLVLMFGIVGVITSYLGANMIFTISEEILSQVLGGFLLGYVVFLSLRPAFKIPKSSVTAITGGALSGFFAGIFGVGGAVRGAFLSAFNLPKAVYISTAGAIALFVDITRITTYLTKGVIFEQKFMWGFILFIPASFLGAALAKKIVGHIPQKRFRLIIAGFLLLVGLKFLLLSS